MIFDFKPRLIHEHTAIDLVSKCIASSCENLINSKEDINDFDLPVSSVVSCLASSHKLDYMTLIKEEDRKRSEIMKVYKSELTESQCKAINLYQSANRQDKIFGLKPYQCINTYLENPDELNNKQKDKAEELDKDLQEAFDKVKNKMNLKIGQRLYRGVTVNKEELMRYSDAFEADSYVVKESYLSTSLSESIAASFSALTYVNKLRQDINKADDLSNLVFVITNRKRGLPFIVPDALRKPNNNQGQMEILLPKNLKLKPTHFELEDFNAKVYMDIV